MSESIIKALTVTQQYVPAIVGTTSGIILMVMQTIKDQLLNSLVSIATSLVIATLTFFLTRFLKKRYK